ncbi:MAG: hypothetical protein K2K83_05655, partial [Rikenella sp.]|nr:hypothetical protein [Rikenella sp.]
NRERCRSALENLCLLITNTPPAPGYRHAYSCSLYAVGLDGYCWTSAVITGGDGYFLLFNHSRIYLNYNYGRAHGIQLRCLQE